MCMYVYVCVSKSKYPCCQTTKCTNFISKDVKVDSTHHTHNDGKVEAELIMQAGGTTDFVICLKYFQFPIKITFLNHVGICPHKSFLYIYKSCCHRGRYANIYPHQQHFCPSASKDTVFVKM